MKYHPDWREELLDQQIDDYLAMCKRLSEKAKHGGTTADNGGNATKEEEK